MIKKIEIEVENLILDILPKKYELVDVEYVKENKEMVLRILIDKSDKNEIMTIDDCVDLSKIIGNKLDELDLIKNEYNLEISSPGLDRILKKDRDFIREKDKKVYVKLYKDLGFGKEFIATLKGLDSEKRIILVVENEERIFNKKDIAKINLHIDI